MDKRFAQIISLICNHFEFSYQLDRTGLFSLSYNENRGIAKILIDGSLQGVKTFLEKIEGHKNKVSGKISAAFIKELPDRKPEPSKKYRITNKKYWFNAETSELLLSDIDFSNVNVTFGYKVCIDAFPDYLFLWHPGTGFDISIAYKNILFGTRLYEGSKDEIITAFIDEIAALGPAFLQNLEDALLED